MTGYAGAPFEYQYDTLPLDFQAQRPRFCNRRQRIGCENNVWVPQGRLGAKFDQTAVAAPSSVVCLLAGVLRHIGTALGGMAANRRSRSRIARYSRRGTVRLSIAYRTTCPLPAGTCINVIRGRNEKGRKVRFVRC
jgi:hypothetical protein